MREKCHGSACACVPSHAVAAVAGSKQGWPMGKAEDLEAQEKRRRRDGLVFESTATDAGAREVAEHALEEWERIDRRARQGADDPLADLLGELGGSDKASAVLRQFMIFCLPPKNYGDSRRFKSGFYRMVAFIWRLSPEIIEGCHTDKDVAACLGISPVAFFRHLEAVDKVLSRRPVPRPKSGTDRGSSRAQ
jgi:hypothetical protein